MMFKNYLIVIILFFVFFTLSTCSVLPYYTADVIVQNLITPESVGKIYTVDKDGYDTFNYALNAPLQIRGFHLKNNDIETLKLDIEATTNTNIDSIDKSRDYTSFTINWFGEEDIKVNMWGKRRIELIRTEQFDESNPDLSIDDKYTLVADSQKIKFGEINLSPNSTWLVSFYMNTYDKSHALEFDIVDEDSDPNVEDWKLYLRSPEFYTQDTFLADSLYTKKDGRWVTDGVGSEDKKDLYISSLIKIRIKKQ